MTNVSLPRAAQARVNRSRSARRAKAYAVLALTSLSCICVASSASAQTATSSEDALAERLHQTGVEAMLKDLHSMACPLLAESYRIGGKPSTLFTLAECEARGGRLATSVLLFHDYLRRFHAMPEKEQLQEGDRLTAADARLAAIGPQVPTLSIVFPGAPPDGVQVRLDGRLLSAPVLRAAIPLDPGEHWLSVQAPGRASHDTTIALTAGESTSVPVSLPTLTERTRMNHGPSRSGIKPEGAPSGSTVLIVTGTVASAVLIGTGVGLTLAAASKSADALEFSRSKFFRIDDCPNRAGCDELKGLLKQHDSIQSAATATFIGGGAMAAATLIYAVMPWASAEKKAGARPQLLVTSSRVGLWVIGSF